MKGHTNNPNGRPKGVANKITADLRQMLNDFVTEEFEAVKLDFKRLEPKERLMYYEKLLAYCILKNSQIEESEPFAEQPLFFEMKSYTLDENTVKAMPYEDLKQLILESEAFMQSKEGKQYLLSLKSPLDINVVDQGKKAPTIILNLGSGINPKD